MKTNELRIGNYIEIRQRYGKKEWHTCKVTLLSDGVIGFYSIKISGRLSIEENSDEIRLIPLTEGWLKDFGLRQSSDKIYNMAMGSILIHHPKSFSFVAGLCDVSGEYDVDIDLRYVHQLQNLYFALTGKELIGNEKAD